MGGSTRAEVGGELVQGNLPHAIQKTWNDVMKWEVGTTVCEVKEEKDLRELLASGVSIGSSSVKGSPPLLRP